MDLTNYNERTAYLEGLKVLEQVLERLGNGSSFDLGNAWEVLRDERNAASHSDE